MTRASKRQQLRQSMGRAARELFLSQGFEPTTMEQVAQRAGVSRRTLFRYFPSKIALVFPEHERRLSSFQRALDRDPERPVLERVRGALMTQVQDCEQGAQGLLDQARIIDGDPALVAAELELDSQWERAMAQTLSEQLEPVHARLLAGALSGLTRATLREWLSSNCTLDLAALARSAQRLITPLEPTL